jgi:hypothetical protein
MPLKEWSDFYVIVGSSAAALTGLMFVVIALLSDQRPDRITLRQINAFGTPTVVHFSAALLQSAIVTAPWPTMTGVRIALGTFGAIGVIYMLIVLSRARGQSDYRPVFEDWLFHTILPLVAYTTVTAAALLETRHETLALFLAGGTAVLLLFIGVHNAWDTVTYFVATRAERREDREPPSHLS